MRAFVITIQDHVESNQAADKCIESHFRLHSSTLLPDFFTIEKFNAVKPEEIYEMMEKYNINWNYPWDTVEHDIKSGLTKSPYNTTNRDAKIACALSHYKLWKFCAEIESPILVLEHDAFFTKKLRMDLTENNYDIIGINDPRGATRKSQDFYDKVMMHREAVISCPYIDSVNVPQGLAGNSAYVIKREGAEKMLELVKEHGLWPNDALMCKQLVGAKLGVTTDFYTRVQGTQSTTTQ